MVEACGEAEDEPERSVQPFSGMDQWVQGTCRVGFEKLARGVP
jgi:hypothetical protein